MKHLGVSLTKDKKDLCTENRKIKENKQRDIPCSWIRRLHNIKMSILLCRVNIMLIKLPAIKKKQSQDNSISGMKI